MRVCVICILIGALIFQSGCTRIILSATGIDPDSVNLNPLPILHEDHFQPLIDKIEPRAGQLWARAIYIKPSSKEIETFVKKNPSVAKVVIAYREEVERTLGSTRSIEEIESKVIPSMIRNVDAAWASYVPSVIKKRNIFNEFYVRQRNISGDVDMTIGDFSPSDEKFSKNILIISPDLSNATEPLISMTINSQTITLSANKVWPPNPSLSLTQELNSAEVLLQWIEHSIQVLN